MFSVQIKATKTCQTCKHHRQRAVRENIKLSSPLKEKSAVSIVDTSPQPFTDSSHQRNLCSSPLCLCYLMPRTAKVARETFWTWSEVWDSWHSSKTKGQSGTNTHAHAVFYKRGSERHSGGSFVKAGRCLFCFSLCERCENLWSGRRRVRKTEAQKIPQGFTQSGSGWGWKQTALMRFLKSK